MDSRITNTRLVCKLTELQDSLDSLSKNEEVAFRETSTAKEGQQAAEKMLKKVRAEHKADIEMRDSKFSDLQAQAAGLANHNEQLQKLVKKHTAELAAVLEQRSQTHLDLKAAHAQTQQYLQAKSDECLKLYKQLEGQTHVINTIEEELRAVRLEFTNIQKAVGCNESRVASHQSRVQALVVTESRLLDQLEAQVNNAVQLKCQKASLKEDLLSKAMALQIAHEEVKARDEAIRALAQEKEAAGFSLNQANKRHAGLLDQLQASNDLVQKLSGTCGQQLNTLDKLQRDMASSHAGNMQRHDKQEQTLKDMRQTEAGLRQTVLELQQRCAVLERQGSCHTPSGFQQYNAAVAHGSLLHTSKDGLALPAEADLPAATESANASHAAAVNIAQQQQAALSGEGVLFTAPTVPPQLPSHGSASTAAQPASPAAKPSISAHKHNGIQTRSATALTPLSLLPPATQQQSLSKCRPAVPTAETPPAVAALSAVATTPATREAHASAEQYPSPQPALDSMLSGQQQQQTSTGHRSSVLAIDDMSELELDADSITGAPAVAHAATAAQPLAPAASQSVSQKRPTYQAPLDVTYPTIPSAKKHKMDDGSADVPTARRSSAQLAGSAAETQQLTVPHLSTSQFTSSRWHVNLVPTSLSSKPPSEVSLSMHTMASSPTHIHYQKAVTPPVTLAETTEAAATRTALPQHLHAAASKLDSNVVEASKQLVLSLPAAATSPSAKAAFVTGNCQLLAAQCGAAAQPSSSTAATSSTCTAVKADIAHASFALFSHSLVTLHPNSRNIKSSAVLPSNTTLFSKQTSSRYRPVIEELPSDLKAAAPTDIRAAANNVLPSKPAMVIDIDSDDDHTVAVNPQPAACWLGRQGQNDKPSESQGSMARLSSQHAMQRDHAGTATRPVQGQACSSNQSPSATEATPCAPAEQAVARKMSFDQAPAPMGMGDIFSSFTALEDLSDAEENADEEQAGTESAAAGQRNSTDSAGSCRPAQLPAASSGTHQPHTQLLMSSAEMQIPGQPVAMQTAGRQAVTGGSCGKCSELDFGYMPRCKSCNIKHHATCVIASLSGSQCICDKCRLQAASGSKKLKAALGSRRASSERQKSQGQGT